MDKLRHNDSVLQIFAKEPRPGEVNTRLTPYISVEQAAQLQHELIQSRLATIAASNLCAVQLWCSPKPEVPYFQQCQSDYKLQLHAQQGTHLGERMCHAIRHGLDQYENVIVIGTDAPALSMQQISEALHRLKQGNDVVIVPAEDGGYVLIAMSVYCPDVFADVDWGTDQVFAKTINNVKKSGLKYVALEESWDIDRIEDYRRYRNGY